MDLPNTRSCAFLLIVALVATGIWFAERPVSLPESWSESQSGAAQESQYPDVYVRRVSWSPDSRKLLCLAHGDVPADGPLVLHDLDDRPHRLPIDVSGEAVMTAVLAGDGRHVVAATHEGRLWWIGLESEERKLLLELPSRFAYSAAAVTADGRQIAAASSDGCIYMCDTSVQAVDRFASGLTSRISDVRFSSDGRRLVCAGQDGWLCVWDVESGSIQERWKGHDQPAMAAAFLSNERVISASLDDTTRIWHRTGLEMWRGDFGLFRVQALAVSADGRTAAWGGYGRRVVVWDLAAGQKKYDIHVPAAIVWDVQFSPDNQSLAVAGTGRTVHLYDAETGREKEEIEFGVE